MNSIRLRALTMRDLPLTLNWHNQPDIVDMYSGHPFPVNEEMEKKWYERVLTSNIPTTVFGIEITDEHKLVGITVLKDINFIHRSAETAIYIGDQQARGKGLSQEALQLTIAFAFENLGLNRVWLKVRSDNLGALKLYRKTGFSEEGKLRQCEYKNGAFHDDIVLSILKAEYKGYEKEQTSEL